MFPGVVGLTSLRPSPLLLFSILAFRFSIPPPNAWFGARRKLVGGIWSVLLFLGVVGLTSLIPNPIGGLSPAPLFIGAVCLTSLRPNPFRLLIFRFSDFDFPADARYRANRKLVGGLSPFLLCLGVVSLTSLRRNPFGGLWPARMFLLRRMSYFPKAEPISTFSIFRFFRFWIFANAWYWAHRKLVGGLWPAPLFLGVVCLTPLRPYPVE